MLSEEQDPMAHRFLGSDVEAPQNQFAALSRQGSQAYIGLETFENPGCLVVTYTSDEVMAKCPVTGQPDWYTCEIQLREAPKLIESKSLKIWFNNIISASFKDDFGIFCEALAVHIRDTMAEATDTPEEHVTVRLVQKSRGGISISAVA